MGNNLIIFIIGAFIAIGIGIQRRRSTGSSPSRSAPASIPPPQTAKPPIDKEKKEAELPSRSQNAFPPPPSLPPQESTDLLELEEEDVDADEREEEEVSFGGINQEQETEKYGEIIDDLIVIPDPKPSKPITEASNMPAPAPPELESNLDDGIPDWLSDVNVSEEELSATAIIGSQADRPLDELDDRLIELRDRGLKILEETNLSPHEQEKESIEDKKSDNMPAPPQADVSTAHFSAFYPEKAQVNQRHGLYVYAHAEHLTDVIERDVSKFREELGGNVPQARVAKDSKSLAHGTKITILPESDELEFEPDILTKRWEGDWKRYEFEFRPKEDLAGDTAFVRVSIMVMGFEIARIKFAIDIEDQQMSAMSIEPMMMTMDNPLAHAKLQHAITSGYDKIFISYSRQDKFIAEAFKVMQEAAGHDVFLDVEDIRAGEDWQAALARAIDSADFIQLFWSEHSSASEFCRYEWDYALKYRCQDDSCAEFIRPVWWDDPFPQPPPELGHLNFKRLNMQILMKE